jgi:hypothetical protein
MVLEDTGNCLMGRYTTLQEELEEMRAHDERLSAHSQKKKFS